MPQPPTHLDVLHELPHVAVPVRGDIAVGLHVEHRGIAPAPPRVLFGQGHRRAPQVAHAGQPLQREGVVGLPAEGGRVVEELDAGRVREDVVVHGGLLVEERPGLVGQAGQRRLVRPEVGAVKDEGLGAAVPGHPPAPGDEAGAARAVDPLRLAGEVGKEAPAPPQQDGQRLVAPRVVVTGAAVRRGGDEGRTRRDGILRPPLRPARLLSVRQPGRRSRLLLLRRPLCGQRGPRRTGQHHPEADGRPLRHAARPTAAPHPRPGPAPPQEAAARAPPRGGVRHGARAPKGRKGRNGGRRARAGRRRAPPPTPPRLSPPPVTSYPQRKLQVACGGRETWHGSVTTTAALP